MQTSQERIDLTAVKLLRLGYTLLSLAFAYSGFGSGVIADYYSPGSYADFIPLILLLAVTGVPTAIFWFLRLAWLFIANNPKPDPVSKLKSEVTFICLVALISFDLFAYHILHLLHAVRP